MKLIAMLKVINIVRYSVSLLLPIIAIPYVGFYGGLITLAVLLFANNVIDDLVFFYGSCSVSSPKNNDCIVCPVEGVVTSVDVGVEKYSHLVKCDTLTREILVEIFGVKANDSRKYSHVTIFLNKLNKHVVTNACDNVRSIVTYDNEGNKYPMVEDGQIVADNKGEYLKNTFVEVEYDNGVVVVVTMDKYISKAYQFKYGKKGFPLMFICRGSQCDIYIPEEYELKPIANGMATRINKSLVVESDYKYIDEVEYSSLILEALKDIKEASVAYIVRDNIAKSFATLSVHNKVALCVLAISILAGQVYAGVFVTLFVFCIDRWCKNLLYSVINVVGYRPSMTKVYMIVHKILSYGK